MVCLKPLRGMAFFTDHTILFYFLSYARGGSADAKAFYVRYTGLSSINTFGLKHSREEEGRHGVLHRPHHPLLFFIICEGESGDAKAFYVRYTGRNPSPLPAKSIVADCNNYIR